MQWRLVVIPVASVSLVGRRIKDGTHQRQVSCSYGIKDVAEAGACKGSRPSIKTSGGS
jgi:hypothetical protein